MFALIPKDKAFFDLFERSTTNVHEGAKALSDLLNDFTDVQSKAARIKDIEHNGDELTHETIQKLNKTFVTPLDREDIHQMVCRIDDVIDLIDTSVAKMVSYKIKGPTPESKKLGDVLVNATKTIDEAVRRLRNIKRTDEILKLCIEIHTYENEGDQIEQQALAGLFGNNMAPEVIIKWKDIYECLEAATDRCEDVANVLEGIVLKNG